MSPSVPIIGIIEDFLGNENIEEKTVFAGSRIRLARRCVLQIKFQLLFSQGIVEFLSRPIEKIGSEQVRNYKPRRGCLRADSPQSASVVHSCISAFRWHRSSESELPNWRLSIANIGKVVRLCGFLILSVGIEGPVGSVGSSTHSTRLLGESHSQGQLEAMNFVHEQLEDTNM